jgi:hypothetical protein
LIQVSKVISKVCLCIKTSHREGKTIGYKAAPFFALSDRAKNKLSTPDKETRHSAEPTRVSEREMERGRNRGGEGPPPRRLEGGQ